LGESGPFFGIKRTKVLKFSHLSSIANTARLCYYAHMERLTAQIQARKEPGEPDAQLARRLGISRSQWRHIQAGRRTVSQKLAARVIAIWPDLEPVYLSEVQRALHGTPTDSADNGKAD
jgi:hypothetical protein